MFLSIFSFGKLGGESSNYENRMRSTIQNTHFKIKFKLLMKKLRSLWNTKIIDINFYFYDVTYFSEYRKLVQMLHGVTMEQGRQDVACWRWNRQGAFTVKSCYKALEGRSLLVNNLHNMWTIRAPMRVMVFTWLMLQDRVLTVDNLMRRGWSMVNMCYMC